MSRTKRRTNDVHEYYWVLRDWDAYFANRFMDRRTKGYQFGRDSKEGIKALAVYHSDAGTHDCKDPGPAWFRNYTSQRPLRRDSARQLRRFLQGEDLEVIIEEMPPLEYWT